MKSSGMAGWAPLKKVVGSLPAWLYNIGSVDLTHLDGARLTYLIRAYNYFFSKAKV